DDGNAFAKEFRRQVCVLDDLSSLQTHFAHRRLSLQPRAFIEKSAVIYQPLSESRRIMRVRMDDFVSVFRNSASVGLVRLDNRQHRQRSEYQYNSKLEPGHSNSSDKPYQKTHSAADNAGQNSQ